jgi:ferrous iron transport protein A
VSSKKPRDLTHLKTGETGVIDHLDLPMEIGNRLMQLGFLPGHQVEAAKAAPGGDPRVYRVDGSEVALRKETARLIFLKVNQP